MTGRWGHLQKTLHEDTDTETADLPSPPVRVNFDTTTTHRLSRFGVSTY